ncbi:hypothetical protein V8G54_019949, partial [Vigna mungo]
LETPKGFEISSPIRNIHFRRTPKTQGLPPSSPLAKLKQPPSLKSATVRPTLLRLQLRRRRHTPPESPPAAVSPPLLSSSREHDSNSEISPLPPLPPELATASRCPRRCKHHRSPPAAMPATAPNLPSFTARERDSSALGESPLGRAWPASARSPAPPPSTCLCVTGDTALRRSHCQPPRGALSLSPLL